MLPTPLRTIVSEVEIQNSIVKNFKQYRTINQIAFYLGDGAGYYYDSDRLSAANLYNYPKITRLLGNVLAEKKGAKIAVVSLACGNCKTDKTILQPLQVAGYPFSFFGVDSSMAMLYKAGEVLNDVTFKARLICADVGAFNFKKELDRIMGEYDVVIYMFFGNIVGNLNQNYMTRMLNTILRPGDYVLLDVAGFKTITPPIREKLLERYTGYLHNPFETRFFLHPLKSLGVPDNCGELVLDTQKDSVTQAEVFKFSFKVKNSLRSVLEGEEIGLSHDEYIELYDILIYNLDKLTAFLEGKDFTLKDQVTLDFKTQLLFKKQ